MRKRTSFFFLFFAAFYHVFSQSAETPQWKTFPFKKEIKFCASDTDKVLAVTEYIYNDNHSLVRKNVYRENNLLLYTEYKSNEKGRIVQENNFRVVNGDTAKFSYFNYYYDETMRLISREWGNSTGVRTIIHFEYSQNNVVKELYYDVKKDSTIFRASNNYEYEHNQISKNTHSYSSPKMNLYYTTYKYIDTLLVSMNIFSSSDQPRGFITSYKYNGKNQLSAVYWNDEIKSENSWVDDKLVKTKFFYNENQAKGSECDGNYIEKYEYY